MYIFYYMINTSFNVKVPVKLFNEDIKYLRALREKKEDYFHLLSFIECFMLLHVKLSHFLYSVNIKYNVLILICIIISHVVLSEIAFNDIQGNNYKIMNVLIP